MTSNELHYKARFEGDEVTFQLLQVQGGLVAVASWGLEIALAILCRILLVSLIVIL